MSGTYAAAMGDRGRLVVPAELRERAGLRDGTPLVFVETPRGVLMLTRPQLRDLVRADLTGSDVVAALLAERRTAAAREDTAR
jgi:bifunctional DNA-binding transcriptional regulator/antitoxin component of YhaV-PrlF toxin-antitoxin module